MVVVVSAGMVAAPQKKLKSVAWKQSFEPRVL